MTHPFGLPHLPHRGHDDYQAAARAGGYDYRGWWVIDGDENISFLREFDIYADRWLG